MPQEILVQIFMGQTLDTYPADQHGQVIKEATDKFVEWLSLDIANMNDPKAKAMAIRLKAVYQYKDESIFDKFPELEGYLAKAYQNFLNNLET